MNPNKRKLLEADGWRVGTVDEFLTEIEDNMVTTDEYRDMVKTLESPVDDQMLHAINWHTNGLLAYLRDAKHTGESLDKLKKLVFYKKSGNEQGATTESDRLQANARLLHAVVGLITEIGEVSEALLNHVEKGEPLDLVNLREELGDIEWYQELLMDVCNTDIDEVREKNYHKLYTRYKDKKFASDDAANRDLDAERKVLE